MNVLEAPAIGTLVLDINLIVILVSLIKKHQAPLQGSLKGPINSNLESCLTII
jgi:hypothetical protein